MVDAGPLLLKEMTSKPGRYSKALIFTDTAALQKSVRLGVFTVNLNSRRLT
jgi:hypothetical protein